MADLRDYSDRKQAVVVIHGIGEQRPMKTLRDFAEAVLAKPENPYIPKYWSKPDRFSEGFELRRLSAPRRRDRPRTDFFEFYWQHLMQGNRLSHVRRWIWTLLWRRPGDVPEHLRALWWFSWAVLLAAGVLAASGMAAILLGELREGYLGPAIGLVMIFAQGFLLGYIADAARYLDPTPQNIPARHKIRSAGIALLKELHRRKRYNRIVVVGHSLGSVIGYDILYHSWIDHHNAHDKPDRPEHGALKALERLARQSAGGESLDLEEFRALQRDYAFELLGQGNPWLVTDFITLGSPLAHAELLLAENKADFAARLADRELPTCPPRLEHGKVFSYRDEYTVAGQGGGQRRTLRVPHHAAPFAPVRWTNIYFPTRFLLFGDIIGGPLADRREPPVRRFGFGVKDVAVATRAAGGLFSHTRYWDDHPLDATLEGAPVKALRDALALDDRPEWEARLAALAPGVPGPSAN